MQQPDITYILATHNRRNVLLTTLDHLSRQDSTSPRAEIIVVDNASRDGTVEAVRSSFPEVRIISLARNQGSCAKTIAINHARAKHIVFLDDDAYPEQGSIPRMLKHFARNPRLGAAGFRIQLADNREECSALPNVFVGCGVGFRTDALRVVGGLDASYFMQAEEYDLAFRLVSTGWSVSVFDDLFVRHLKTPHARKSARTTYFDTRNNLILTARFLPDDLYKIYHRDWSDRYRMLARRHAHTSAWWRGRIAAAFKTLSLRRGRFARQRLNPEAIETFFQLSAIERHMQTLSKTGVRRIILADLGKNIHAFHAAAKKSGLTILGIADDLFSQLTPQYRDIPMIPTSGITDSHPDAIVVSNTSYVHAAATRDRLTPLHPEIPLHAWFTTPQPPETTHFASENTPISADRTPTLSLCFS